MHVLARVADCGLVIREKLEHHGLIEASAETVAAKQVSIGDFTLAYIANRSDVKPGCKTVWRRCRRLLLNFFPEDRPIASITVGDAKDFRQTMLREGRAWGGGLAENTVRKACSVACQFFSDALDRKLVTVNPFVHKDIPRTIRENRTRDFFVTRELADQVLAADKDVEGRLIFALCRYGGLRCPSEHLALRWPDVDFKAGRILVHSPKTEHHVGKENRIIPLFPELLPHLKAAYEAAADKTGFVIARYRVPNTNLRTRFYKLLKRIGLKPWPKLFHNLRATRETELAAEFPLHVVTKWIGNSALIASRSYLQVRDEDYARATEGVRHIPLQQMPAEGGTGMNSDERPKRKRKQKPKEPPKTQGNSMGSRWAMRDSNPRHPLCKSGALTS
jgi:integrase